MIKNVYTFKQVNTWPVKLIVKMGQLTWVAGVEYSGQIQINSGDVNWSAGKFEMEWAYKLFRDAEFI